MSTPTARFVTDGGMETDLIHHHGAQLPHFAAFPLVDDESGRALLTRYYDDYAAIAAAAGADLLIETPTWRASGDWGDLLGYPAEALAAVNRDAVALGRELADAYSQRVGTVRVRGMVGPRGDGYSPASTLTPDESARYHDAQIVAFADAGADGVVAYTLTHAAEGIGIVRAARAHGLPVTISFTVETDGRLPDGTTLAEAIDAVDAEAAPDDFMVNCAHPDHVAAAGTGDWAGRVTGVRSNASQLSHAELDAMDDLDDGDPDDLAAATARLTGPLGSLGSLAVLGGCCGTDARHVAAMWGVTL